MSSELVAWSELPRHTKDQVWTRVCERFDFRPSVDPVDWPGIAEPTPSTTYSIAEPFRTATDRESFSAMAMRLNLAILHAVRRCVDSAGSLYALAWQHPCYTFYPHATEDFRCRNNWRVQPFPDGDYYLFLDPELTFGTFGHPWEQTMCLFGQRLMDAF